MICNYCGKTSCRHRNSVGRAEKVASGSPTIDDLPQTGIGVPRGSSTEAPSVYSKAGDSLWVLTGLRDLECVICRYVAPSGKHQTALRYQHSLVHVQEGSAVEDSRGLPAGATRFLVKAKATA